MIIILILLLSTLSAQDFEIKGARLNYHGSHILHDWVGTSNDLKGRVFIDNDQSEYFVELNVPLRSFSSKNSNRDSNMLFATEALDYPTITFKSTSINIFKDSVKVVGNLSFHGVSKKIESTAKFQLSNDFSAKGSFKINLSDYDIERPTLMFIKIDDEIKIEYFIK